MAEQGRDAPSNQAQTSAADFCLWWPLGTRSPCYAQAGYVLVRPSGETLSYTCAAHKEARREGIRGPFLIVDRAEWEKAGSGYRGAMLGG